MSKFLKQFGFVALLLIIIVGISGCENSDTQENQGAKKASQTQDKKTDDGKQYAVISNDEGKKTEDGKVFDEVNNETKEDKIIVNSDGSYDISNWKTYTNEDFGFTMKYPADREEIRITPVNYERKSQFEIEDVITIKCGKVSSKNESLAVGINRNNHTIDEIIDNDGIEGRLTDFNEINELVPLGHRKIKQIGKNNVYIYQLTTLKSPNHIYIHMVN